ncbi:MAG: HAMP domain-containing histidine kinase, partial [Alphaproteobacteria bacterium]|nr:HAMP domain-containing histidine kinase [Alphaproteobacteria bacterium]
MQDTDNIPTQQSLLEEIANLKHDLAIHRDTEARLERHASELVGIAEDLDATRADLQNLVHQRDRFFSIIAHDLRSPFNALLGFTELLASQSQSLPRASIQEYANLAHVAGRQTHKLLENLLEWSRLQTGSITYNPASFLLTDIAQDAVALFNATAAAKDINLHSDIEVSSAVMGDPIMVDTILRNLIDNAIKFTPKGGEILVSAKQVDHRVTITVRDNGVGISSKNIARLFKLDDKVSTSGTDGELSSGLGLQLCHELAALHGGPITV